MATTSDILLDAFDRVREVVRAAVGGLDTDALAWRPADGANSIGWLVWHLTRIQDDHVADLAGGQQVWTAGGWNDRFDLPFDPADTGFGHSPDEVTAVRVESPDLLVGYLDEVYQQTVAYVRRLDVGELERVVDERWDPPVTAGVRLVSVLSDNLQHAGQAAYVRGLLPADGR